MKHQLSLFMKTNSLGGTLTVVTQLRSAVFWSTSISSPKIFQQISASCRFNTITGGVFLIPFKRKLKSADSMFGEVEFPAENKHQAKSSSLFLGSLFPSQSFCLSKRPFQSLKTSAARSHTYGTMANKHGKATSLTICTRTDTVQRVAACEKSTNEGGDSMFTK